MSLVCPNCKKGQLKKALYGKLPLTLCSSCSSIYGICSLILPFLGSIGLFNGQFVIYTGSYFKALFLKNKKF